MASFLRRNWRIILVFLVAGVALALSWWRTPVSFAPSRSFTAARVAMPAPPGESSLRVTDIWDISGSGAGFGGFSALVALPDGEMRSFSDRGWRLSFSVGESGPGGFTTAQVVPQAGYGSLLYDIESATASGSGESYWLGYEAYHAIHRFGADDAPDGLRDLSREIDWYDNGGIEAMVRLDDGRFVVFGEGSGSILLFAGDPVEGAQMQEVLAEWPDGFLPTDAAHLPDGRILVLLRRFSITPLPSFASMLVVGPAEFGNGSWKPEVLADLGDLLPAENYEGLAVRSLANGRAELWLISDDNFSAFQRTLLVRMVTLPPR